MRSTRTTRITTATATVATTLLALTASSASALTPATDASPRASEAVVEKGVVLECTGEADGLSAYVNLYENDTYSNYLQVVLDDDPKRAASREPKDILKGRKVRAAITVDGKRARIVGTATRVGPRTRVHEELDDAGQHVVMHGYHRRLAHRLVLRYDGATVPLRCDPAFFYRLRVTKTPVSE
ncbi:hypothetical protein [Nocardioides sp. 503]|uniref:hypothetical protein n=1 Tax=Nocardioides sp. 503 TaxID=2508326 RepID=UPI00106F5247|nr:hypothetical protein [Nocardioides sp. 503]